MDAHHVFIVFLDSIVCPGCVARGFLFYLLETHLIPLNRMGCVRDDSVEHVLSVMVNFECVYLMGRLPYLSIDGGF